MIKTHETLVRARVESTSCADEERARDADHAGHVHEPDKPYTVPDSEHAWGRRAIGTENRR